jgi:hexosaminidase
MKAWKTCPLCQQKMKEEGFKKENQLQAYLIRRIAAWLKAHNKQLLGWDEIIADSLGSNASVMVWRTQEYAADALKKGYNVVLAPNSHCYINRQQDAPELGSAGGYLSLEKIYSFKPLKIDGITAQNRKNVLGVQACLWTEFVNEAADAEYMMWPRLLAMSEIGWRGEAPEKFTNFRKRALVFADAIRKQKVNVFDLRKEKGERKESLKPVKHLAVGAKVTYNHRYSNAYAASKEATLVDGQLGGWNHSDRLWQGFIGKESLDFVVDLGKEMPIKSVAMEFMQNAGPDIYYPATLTISLSADGSNYEQVYRQEQPEVKDGLQFKTWQWNGKKRARYIHVVGTQPRSNMWIFTDEIIVK